MLVLSRTVGAKITIGGKFAVEVINEKSNRITIGFKAPAEVKVLSPPHFIRRGTLG